VGGARQLAHERRSLRRWLQTDTSPYAVQVLNGHRALAVVYFAALVNLSGGSLATDFATAVVTHLGGEATLEGRHLRQIRAAQQRGDGVEKRTPPCTVHQLVKHLALTIQGAGADEQETAAVGRLLCQAVDLELSCSQYEDETPLYWAVRHCQMPSLRLLVQLLPRVDSPTKTVQLGAKGRTALIVAAEYDAPEMVRLLLARRADVHAATDDGRTALHFAAAAGNVATVRFLLSAEGGADANAQSRDGRTALHQAAENGHVPPRQHKYIYPNCR
jgi:hypothetical protein